MHGVCILHRMPRAWKRQGRSKRKKQIPESQKESNNKSGRKERGHYRKKSPKQGLPSPEDLTILNYYCSIKQDVKLCYNELRNIAQYKVMMTIQENYINISIEFPMQ